jgi:drug/metabolite transporter (DMT)-like permease
VRAYSRTYYICPNPFSVNPEKRIAYLQIHVAIFLWGFTAILGRWITLKEVPLVWYRVLITCIGLLFVPGVIKGLKTLSRQNILLFLSIGCLIALHWVAFYGSIKQSNVSVALSGLATTSLFTSFIEPLLFKKRVRPTEVILGLLVIVGIYVIFNGLRTDYYLGFIMGLVAAVLAALFSTLNKKYIDNADPKSITFTELLGGFLFLSLSIPVYLQFFPDNSFIPEPGDWLYLVILSWVCTAFTMVISLKALKHLSAFATNLSLNLEPVYGILLAWVIFGENKDLSPNFYTGAIIIIFSVFLHPVLESKTLKHRIRSGLRR